jgi:hypothetical protein
MTEWIGCDKCNSVVPAMYLVKLVSGELAFCGHHFRAYKAGLDKVSYEVIELNKVEETPQLVEMAE